MTSSHHPSQETMLTNTVTNTSYHEDNQEIWQPMNKYTNEPVLYENTKTYQFQPIDQDFSSNSNVLQGNISHAIQRPVPVSNPRPNSTIERPKKPSTQYTFPGKRNSTLNLDCPIRSSGLPRSMTSDHLATNTSNRLYYYPSVQDVLDALNQRSFEKESFV